MVLPTRMVAPPPLIRIRNLTKVYHTGNQTVCALNGIDLDIPSGSFTVIMGPSGSGKSTLLYLIGGLDSPTTGNILVNGDALERMDENSLAKYRRRTVGFVFQSFNLAPVMDALENVSLPMYFDGILPSKRQHRAFALLRQVGLTDRSNHYPSELSGGQQQRVAIARALVNAPLLVLCDEPTGNLDSVSGMAIMELLASVQTGGRTLIVVTHDPHMKQFASQTVYLLDGRVVNEEAYAEKIQATEPTPIQSR